MGARSKRDQETGALTRQQERFAREYVANGGNATRAAIAAGYKEKWADSQGPKLTGNPRVAAFINELQAVVNKRLDITAEEVLQIAANIARTRIDQVLSFGPDGVIPKDSSTLSPEVLSAVAEVTQSIPGSGDGGSIKIKLADKLGAIEKLGKHFKLWNEKQEVASPFEGALAAMTEAQCIERAEALRAARLRAQAEAEGTPG